MERFDGTMPPINAESRLMLVYKCDATGLCDASILESGDGCCWRSRGDKVAGLVAIVALARGWLFDSGDASVERRWRTGLFPVSCWRHACEWRSSPTAPTTVEDGASPPCEPSVLAPGRLVVVDSGTRGCALALRVGDEGTTTAGPEPIGTKRVAFRYVIAACVFSFVFNDQRPSFF